MEPPGRVGRYARTAAAPLLVVALCLLALVGPAPAQPPAATHARVHASAAVLAADLHGSGHRFDSPDALGTPSVTSTATAVTAGTGSSSKITSQATADSARMRGPPVEGAL